MRKAESHGGGVQDLFFPDIRSRAKPSVLCFGFGFQFGVPFSLREMESAMCLCHRDTGYWTRCQGMQPDWPSLSCDIRLSIFCFFKRGAADVRKTNLLYLLTPQNGERVFHK